MAPPSTASKRLKITEENPLPEGAPKDHSHTWKIFVADPLGEDVSYFIKKVVFKLHDTYPNPIRSIESPPFEVNETGWGEFEISIKIFFITESSEKNITLYHHLKLHPYSGYTKLPNEDDLKKLNEVKRIESVLYDELVFNEPTEKMFSVLTSKPGSLLPLKSTQKLKFSKQMERNELDRISYALNEIKKQHDEKLSEFKELEKEKQEILNL
ncbi:hypothetical protein B5S32_g3856 [[Candida] boidinii]|nr:hypothetical protein B5S32_g3856 [[Candida] boidinii]